MVFHFLHPDSKNTSDKYNKPFFEDPLSRTEWGNKKYIFLIFNLTRLFSIN